MEILGSIAETMALTSTSQPGSPIFVGEDQHQDPYAYGVSTPARPLDKTLAIALGSDRAEPDPPPAASSSSTDSASQRSMPPPPQQKRVNADFAALVLPPGSSYTGTIQYKNNSSVEFSFSHPDQRVVAFFLLKNLLVAFRAGDPDRYNMCCKNPTVLHGYPIFDLDNMRQPVAAVLDDFPVNFDYVDGFLAGVSFDLGFFIRLHTISGGVVVQYRFIRNEARDALLKIEMAERSIALLRQNFDALTQTAEANKQQLLQMNAGAKQPDLGFLL